MTSVFDKDAYYLNYQADQWKYDQMVFKVCSQELSEDLFLNIIKITIIYLYINKNKIKSVCKSKEY